MATELKLVSVYVQPCPHALFGKRRYGGKTEGARVDGSEASTFRLHKSHNALRTAHYQSHNPKRIALDQAGTPGDDAGAHTTQ